MRRAGGGGGGGPRKQEAKPDGPFGGQGRLAAGTWVQLFVSSRTCAKGHPLRDTMLALEVFGKPGFFLTLRKAGLPGGGGSPPSFVPGMYMHFNFTVSHLRHASEPPVGSDFLVLVAGHHSQWLALAPCWQTLGGTLDFRIGVAGGRGVTPCCWHRPAAIVVFYVESRFCYNSA